jgi:hypothetical protein
MANWYGSARSNYFRVKDRDAFLKWAERRGVGLFTNDNDTDSFAIHPGGSTDSGGWPALDTENDAELDLTAELAEHLSKGQVAILMEIGAEKLRYVTGDAIAVNSRGRVVFLSLGDIYRKAARAFRVPENEITRAEY